MSQPLLQLRVAILEPLQAPLTLLGISPIAVGLGVDKFEWLPVTCCGNFCCVMCLKPLAEIACLTYI